MRAEVAAEAGLPEGVRVVAPATHDTASAVAAVPAAAGGERWAYLSSGTWSLLGMELQTPILSIDALHSGFTNERGVAGRIRFLRNIGGLWLIQQLRDDLERRGETLGYEALVERATAAEPLRTLVDPNAEAFAQPGDFVAKLAAHAERSGQPTPRDAGEMARCCLESLALAYAATLADAERLSGRGVDVLHVVGGGVQNRLLSRLAADATGVELRLGPVEATAVGNALVQAMGLGLIGSIEELRRVVADSFPLETVNPAPSDLRSAATRERFAALCAA